MASKSTFAERLARVMQEQNLSASDVARRVFGTMEDERGYTVARNRQIIGKYLRDEVEPRTHTKRLIAEHLGVRLSDLMPESDPLERRGSGVIFEMENNAWGWLEFKVRLPKEVARQIIDIVRPYTK